MGGRKVCIRTTWQTASKPTSYHLTPGSHSYCITGFGARMAKFLREEAPPLPCPAGFLGDLAELEWAIVEVIHAPSAPSLTLT